MVAKSVLSSWSCKPRKEPTTLFMDLMTAGDGSLSFRSSDLRLISIAGDYGQALLAPELLSELLPIMESPDCKVVGHNLLQCLGTIRTLAGRRLKLTSLWDTMLAWQMLNNGLSRKESSLPSSTWPSSDRQGELSSKQLEYAARQSANLEPIYERQKELIDKSGLAKVAELEFLAIPAILEIENSGIGFNTANGVDLLARLKMEEVELTREILLFAKSKGFPGFNPRNPSHSRNMLLSLGHRVENTAAVTLQRISREYPDDKFVNLLLRYRELKQQQTLLNSWVSFARDDRIYPHIEQLGALGGRITCSKPNIQQVPRDPRLKGLFEAGPGMSLVEADFSAIEMRLIAVLSGDKNLINIFKKGLDPHKQTAQAIFQKSEISDDERQIAKTLNYGTIYGGGVNMVISQLPNLTEVQAREFIRRFYDAYPGLKGWQRNVTERAPDVVVDGKVYRVSRSALGRIRYVDPGYRNALINTPVQASGADLQKISLGRLYQSLALPKYAEFKLVNAVHDSILLEVPDKRAKEAAKLLQRIMEEAGDEMLKVIPCLTDVKIGKDWSFREDIHRSVIGAVLHGAASIGRRLFGH